MSDMHKYFEQENDNPISLLARRMKIPLVASMFTGLLVQYNRGRFEAPAIFGSMAYATLPICGASFLFLGTTYAAKRIRGKDDAINYLIGVLPTIPIVRNFLSVSYTYMYVCTLNYCIITTFCGYQPLENFPSVDERMDLGTWKSGHDIYKWARNSLSGPLVERKG